ncbi:hypothetical protein PanWU01x14_364430 [Parasponia andersonii]|uniref:Uncharacterized protein n=1 Tax=Parasponia andersonii TaxID=3476 RepID=A0A2P5A6B0_PARAD|nr:hypothetical protein PanWU01x14_364430 [Parasponia andersonii]
MRRNLENEDGEGQEWRGVKEGSEERGLGGGEEVGEALEDGHLVDQLVDLGDVGGLGQADPGEDRVAHWGRPLRHGGGWRRSWSRRRWRCCGGHFGFGMLFWFGFPEKREKKRRSGF